MKTIKLILLIVLLAFVNKSFAQVDPGQIIITFQNKVISGCNWSFDVYATAGTGYTAPDNDWSSMNIRMDVMVPANCTIATVTNTANPGAVSGASGTNIVSGAAPVGSVKMGLNYLRTTGGQAELTSTPLKLSSVVVVFTPDPGPPTGACPTSSDIGTPRPSAIGNQGSNWVNGVDFSNHRVINFPSTVLPVTFNSFTGINVNCAALLKWTTESEVNSSLYVIEGSSDGSNFTKVGQILSTNAALGSSYSFSTPLVSANNFFRIKAVDFDGKTAYNTKIVNIKNTCVGTATIGIYPNPAVNTVTVYGLHGRNTIYITNELCQKMVTILNTTNAQVVSVANYPSGTYVIGIVNQNGTKQSIKFVKI